MIKKAKEIFLVHIEGMIYLIFGGLATLLNWIMFAILERSGLGLSVSNFVSWFISVIFVYISNKLFVFGSRNWKLSYLLPEIGKFLVARILTGILEMEGVPFLMCVGFSFSLFGVEAFGAKILVTVIIVIVNYVLSKIMVFRNR